MKPKSPAVCKGKRASAIEAKRRSIERRYSTEQQSKTPIPKKKREKKIEKVVPEITVIEIPTNLQEQKPKSEIQIPSWRPSSFPPNYVAKRQDIQEDLSDAAFEMRHQKAEEEEQMLWEKWTAMREAEGKAEGGRSQSSAWREVDLVLAPRLRSQRLCSLLSNASSTPGRLSPTTLGMVQEICVESISLPNSSEKPPSEQPPEKRRRPEPKSLLSVLNEVLEEGQNLRRVQSEIRRASASSNPSQQKSKKENVGDDDEQEAGRRHTRQVPSPSNSSRVLKDSNLVLAKAQLTRCQLL